MKQNTALWLFAGFVFLLTVVFFLFPKFLNNVSYTTEEALRADAEEAKNESVMPTFPPLDKVAYDLKLTELANNPPPKTTPPPAPLLDQGGEGSGNSGNLKPIPQPKPNIWPIKTVYPNDGAILPFNRIIAYYGNLYSTKMGVLGQYSEAEMLSRLGTEVKKWEAADPNTPVISALHYIAVVAQGSAGGDGKYRARMPASEIDKVLAIAEKINAIVFLDIQVGFSTIQAELPLLSKYLKLPNVHLGMDPEFSMKHGIRPGKIVGTYDAEDINFAAQYLSTIVKENNLSPKILVVHRYTQNMVTNYREITPLPEVQIVMHMDGWGTMAKKIGTYKNFIYPEPVQFTGFKLFYKNDVWEERTTLMTPADILKLRPIPSYIQ